MFNFSKLKFIVKKYSIKLDIERHGKFILAGFVIAVTAFGYMSYEFYILGKESTTQRQELNNKITALNQELLAEKGENLDLTTNLHAKEGTIDNLVVKISKTEETVTTLEKIVRTDPELLVKYSKVFFLNENYQPASLIDIETRHLYNEEKEEQVESSVIHYLEQLIDAASRNNLTLQIISAYRSFDTQSSLKSRYKFIYGAGTANQFSADQGYSEHQLGTTVDFTTPSLDGALKNFETTDVYTWLINNAHRYGFTLSYPEDNEFYVYEPWHWRFVGIKLATFLRDSEQYFYDLDQREIDSYLVNIFDQL